MTTDVLLIGAFALQAEYAFVYVYTEIPVGARY
jgi:hypothetical protein